MPVRFAGVNHTGALGRRARGTTRAADDADAADRARRRGYAKNAQLRADERAHDAERADRACTLAPGSRAPSAPGGGAETPERRRDTRDTQRHAETPETPETRRDTRDTQRHAKIAERADRARSWPQGPPRPCARMGTWKICPCKSCGKYPLKSASQASPSLAVTAFLLHLKGFSRHWDR